MKTVAKLVFGCVCLAVGLKMLVEGTLWEYGAQVVAGMILILFAYVWLWTQAPKKG